MMQHDWPVMTALFGQRCTERQSATQARPGKPMYLTIQGEGDHPEDKGVKQKTLKQNSHLNPHRICNKSPKMWTKTKIRYGKFHTII